MVSFLFVPAPGLVQLLTDTDDTKRPLYQARLITTKKMNRPDVYDFNTVDTISTLLRIFYMAKRILHIP